MTLRVTCLLLSVAVPATVTGQFKNYCPRTSDYEYCPLFSYDDQTVGDCPSGWVCDGDARLASGYDGLYFHIGGDGPTGSATSDYLQVPKNAVELVWERCGGADDGGVRVDDAEGNAICTVTDGTNTNTMFEQSCDMTAHALQCIRIYAWDNINGGWGHVYLNNFEFRDESGNALDTCPNDCGLFPIDNFLGECSATFLANDEITYDVEERLRVVEEWKEGVRLFGADSGAVGLIPVELKDTMIIMLLFSNLLFIACGVVAVFKWKRQDVVRYGKISTVQSDAEMTVLNAN